MAVISRDLRFIYIRVPRTGSTTFTHHLNGLMGPLLANIGEQHATACEIRELLDPAQLLWDSDYASFGFIRNPWDWLVSVYNSHVSSGAGMSDEWSGIPERVIAPGMHPGECTNGPFPEWVRRRKTTPMDWLTDGGNVLVDRVLRMEDLYGDHILNAVKRPDERPHYRDWYDAELADYVGEKCKREIQEGNYVF